VAARIAIELMRVSSTTCNQDGKTVTAGRDLKSPIQRVSADGILAETQR